MILGSNPQYQIIMKGVIRMLDIKTLASGSKGNAYIVSDGETKILFECGIPFRKMQELTDFTITDCKACMLSHSHKDHSLALSEVLSNGIDIFTSETLKYSHIGLKQSHRAYGVKDKEQFTVGTFKIVALKMCHDVECFGWLLYSDVTKDKLLFAIDTYLIPYNISGLNYIMVEANYSLDILDRNIKNGSVPEEVKYRLLKSHMQLDVLLEWLKKLIWAEWKRFI